MDTEKQADATAAYLIHAANTLPDSVEALGRAVAYMEYHGKNNPRMQLFAATLRPVLEKSLTVEVL